MNSKYDFAFSEEEKNKMREEYLNGYSIRDIAKKYNIKSSLWIHKKLLEGIARNNSEAGVFAHKKHPDSFKHTDESKKKMREIRLTYMKEHPECTAWRKRNEPSYPEKCFIKFLKENEYDKKYFIEREKSVFPFYIDFAFMPDMVAVEIDGSQHILDEERIKRDKEKDELLISKGWKVLRVTENLVKTDWKQLKQSLDNILSSNIKLDKVGIFTLKGRTYEKKARNENGRTEKMEKSFFSQRKVKERPSYCELVELKRNLPMTKIGKIFGVSDNTIRKWIKQYEKFGNFK